MIGLHCSSQHTLSHKQLVHARLRLVEAAVEFSNQQVNQLKLANLSICLDVLN